MGRYADILLPLFQPLYTFAVEASSEPLSEGDAVAVQFGPKAVYTGIVWRLHDRKPETAKTIKSVGRKLYPRPLLSKVQMRFWEWLADYYMCTPGEIMRFALPALIKPRAGSEEAFEREEFRPRMLTCAVAGVSPSDEERERLQRRAPKQSALLAEVEAAGEIPRARCDAAALTALLKKGFLRLVERETDRFADEAAERDSLTEIESRLPRLTEAQQAAYDKIAGGMEGRPTALLRGVAGSGKTEIYMHLAARVLAEGGDVLMLVPEIALTTQLVARIRRIFGRRVTPYHSKLTPVRRTETYRRLNDSEGGNFVVGARSALFLPLHRLRLVIVDEEHDPSYKQTEPAPRYHARDAALMLAQLCGAATVLGSATPSLESYVRAQTGKYADVRLDQRYGGGEPPRISISDTMRSVKRGERHSHFNKETLEAIAARLERGEQVLLFQNRRGYSPYVACDRCGTAIRCPRCNVTMSLHGGDRLVCHYCGRTEPKPRFCPSCREGQAVPMGFGTEKVEAEIATLFPEARIVRLDRDSAPSQSACDRIIGAFERGEADIMVGTQIITKGLDFPHVTLAAILNADNLLNAPDYRASERAFQTIMQFAGRGGRRDVRGEVIIQTSQPDHPVLLQAARGDYEAMARQQSAERQTFGYPPYARLIVITLRHREQQVLLRASGEFAAALRRRFAGRVFGPDTLAADRIRDRYSTETVLKIESGASMSRARELLRDEIGRLLARKEYKSLTLFCNVDA